MEREPVQLLVDAVESGAIVARLIIIAGDVRTIEAMRHFVEEMQSDVEILDRFVRASQFGRGNEHLRRQIVDLIRRLTAALQPVVPVLDANISDRLLIAGAVRRSRTILED